jgi:DNA-binding response OmpR family regulator
MRKLKMSHMMNNILVVDDDEAFRRVVQSTLDMHGFKVIAVANGEDGLRQARALLPDLILSDLHMANGDGYELLKSLTQTSDTACIPIIIMTGQGDVAEMRHSMELGADDFLLKPLSASTIHPSGSPGTSS